MKRVVITGMGVISPIGNDVDTFWNHLVAGKSGITAIDQFDTTHFTTKIAGTVKGFQADSYMSSKEIRQYDRYLQFAVAATQQAIEQARLDVSRYAERVGVYIGTGIGGIHTLLQNHQTFLERGPRRVSPFMIPMMIGNIAAGQISILTGARGPSMATMSACATSNHAIGEALHAIRSGRADIMIAGGAEASIHELSLAGFCNMHAMSTNNENPEQACRPFDMHRDGFVMSEGAGILLLESLESAQSRGASVLAEIAGYGSSSDAYHITATDPEGGGAYRAMKAALEDADINPEAVDYINAHATSTPLGDQSETKAIQALYQQNGKPPLISSTKSVTGHLFGAAGAVEAVACIQAIANNTIPPTINYETPDPNCNLDYVPNQARSTSVKVAMSNGFGFGGHNAVLVFRSGA
jgi:3-oxoacyl-[acyl-carrier-protein] synthase II